MLQIIFFVNFILKSVCIFFQEFYPVNILRNVGLNNSKTDYVLLSDVDFVPVSMLYNYTTQLIARQKDRFSHQVVLFVLLLLSYSFVCSVIVIILICLFCYCHNINLSVLLLLLYSYQPF